MKFKQFFVIYTAILFFSGSLLAADFFAGAKIGPGAAFVYGDDTDDYDSTAGMSMGVFGTYSPIKFFAVQTEINYEMKGYSHRDDSFAGSSKVRYHLNYFSIPIMAKGFFPISRLLIQPYLGLNFSFLMNANYKGKYDGTFGNYTVEKRNTDDYEVFDLGILFGAETFIRITEHIFVTADLRFNIGVLEVVDDNETFNGTFYALFGAAYKF